MAWDYQEVRVEEQGAVAVVTLNRPDRLNAWTPTLHGELHDALAKLDRDEGCRAIVVTGAGRAFCAGADLGRGDQGFGGSTSEFTGESVPAREMVTPVIAAMNGHAIGVGLTLPLQWDLRLVAEEAKLQFAFTQRGIIPELGSTWLVPRLVGLARAAELLLTGEVFSGARAAEWGLCNRALPAAEVLPAAVEMASGLAERTSPLAVGVTKRLLARAVEPGVGFDDARAWDDRLFPAVGRSADAEEGIMAFLEKRPPAWKSRKADVSGLL